MTKDVDLWPTDSSLLGPDLQLLAGHVTCVALRRFTFYLPKWISFFIMTLENGLWTPWSSAGKTYHQSCSESSPSPRPQTPDLTVSSNSSCCLQWNFHNPGSMSQNGSSNCLTNWADCLEPGVYNENHQPSCFLLFWQPGSSAGGRGTLHPGGSKMTFFSLAFCLPFTDCFESPSLCPVAQVLVKAKVWAPEKAHSYSLSLATTQGFCSLSLEMSQ